MLSSASVIIIKLYYRLASRYRLKRANDFFNSLISSFFFRLCDGVDSANRLISEVGEFHYLSLQVSVLSTS
jgi:hypothetical protein